jgi:hypothetical protein
MTALPKSTAHHCPRPRPSSDDTSTDHGDVLAGGDVPIAVWRLDDRDDAGPGTDPEERFAARLAQRLVGVYTRHGDAVVDFDGDPHLQAASIRACRSYVSLTDPGDVAGLDDLAEPASLVVLRWPSRHPARTPASIVDLFAACRLIMTADSCAIAAVTSADPGQTGATFADNLRELLPGARAAGLTHVLQIVALTAAGRGDQFLYYATAAEAAQARRGRPAQTGAPHHHVDLLVFTSPGRGDMVRRQDEGAGSDTPEHADAQATAGAITGHDPGDGSPRPCGSDTP